jgi:hypothetical protein
MSIIAFPTMPPSDVPTSQGERRIRSLQKLLLIIFITVCIVLVGGGALLYFLSKSKDAGTQVASTRMAKSLSNPSSRSFCWNSGPSYSALATCRGSANKPPAGSTSIR